MGWWWLPPDRRFGRSVMKNKWCALLGWWCGAGVKGPVVRAREGGATEKGGVLRKMMPRGEERGAIELKAEVTKKNGLPDRLRKLSASKKQQRRTDEETSARDATVTRERWLAKNLLGQKKRWTESSSRDSYRSKEE